MTIAYPKAGEHNIYSDLMQEFVLGNHKVFIACSCERRNNKETDLTIEEGKNVLRIKTGNMTGNINIIEKGISTLLIESAFIKAINKFFVNTKFDLIIYSTPPITFVRAVQYFKNRDKAYTYLLLKDIFPQNAVDIKLMNNSSLIYCYFRNKERKLYSISDFIGCMSQANVEYILDKNHELDIIRVEICPNSIATTAIINIDNLHRKKYNIPDDCVVFVYGGNLGRPQGVDFIIECLKKNMNLVNRFFIICGQGSDYYKLETFFSNMKPNNALLFKMLPKSEYDDLLLCCDVGLIFLDHRFTIPNFPSRLLSYMEYSMPVLACTDRNTDIGEILQRGNFGWWCESNNSDGFSEIINRICLQKNEISLYGNNAREYLEENYTSKTSYEIIMRHFVE